MNNHFRQYEAILRPILSENNAPKNDFYARLFTEGMGENDKYINLRKSFDNNALLTHWLNGKSKISKKYVNYVINNYDTAVNNFKSTINHVLNGKIIDNKTLSANLQGMFSNDIITLNNNNIINNNNGVYDNCAKALALALVCDGIHDHEDMIEAELRIRLRVINEECKRKNVAFRSIRILYSVLQEQDSVLYNALETLKNGLGKAWSKKTAQYIDNKEHMPYKENNPCTENEWVNTAKMYAFAQGYAQVNKYDLIYSVPYVKGSKTISCLYIDMGNINPDYWKNLVDSLKGSTTTTI